MSKLSVVNLRLSSFESQSQSQLNPVTGSPRMFRQVILNLRNPIANANYSVRKVLLNKDTENGLLKSLKRELATVHSSQKGVQKVTPFGWFLLIIPGTTFCLGCWQVKRKIWKENLIKELNEKISTAPANLPDNLDEVESMEFRPVVVRGRFLHDKELYLGPRSFVNPDEKEPRSSLFTKEPSIGYLVITPFKLSEREETILVNRGWVPKTFLNPNRRLQGQVEGETELVGIVRKTEPRPQFSPDHKGGTYLYRDVPRMCSQTGASPIFLDAIYDSTVDGGPIGGQTRISLRNDHLSYLITWFCLSGATSFAWYRQIIQRKPF